MELEDGLTIHFKTKVDDENHVKSVFEQTEGEVHMQIIRLSDNIQLNDFEFHGANEEVFSSASWNEEIRIIDGKQTIIKGVINRSSIRKKIKKKILCKMYNGVYKNEDIRFEDLKNEYIELPLNIEEKGVLKSSVAQKSNRLELGEIIVNKRDYKQLYFKLKNELGKQNIMLIEMNGICQYVLFNLMTSDGIKGYGYKNVINTNLVYRIGERIESKSQIFLGTDIYSCLEKTFAETAWEKLCEKVNLKKFVPNDIDELIIQSNVLAKIVYIYYFTMHVNNLKNRSMEISEFLTIKLNDFDNKTVGGNIDGSGRALKEQYICKEGKVSLSYRSLRRYDYRENIRYKLDKIKILSGNIDIELKKKGHIVLVDKICGIEESFNPITMDFTAFLYGKEYQHGKLKSRIEISTKINLEDILIKICGVGNKCKYELDGNILAPDVVVKRTILK